MKDDPEKINQNLNIEIELLLEAIYRKYGYDFRDYGKAHLKRRLMHRINSSGLESISELQHKILYDRNYLKTLLEDLSITVTEMFRDPSFYAKLRIEVFPILKTYPYFKIWHAGCSTGQEVYSMAIMMQEEGILNRAQIYATDFNQIALSRAKEGIYPIEKIREYTANYQKAGGKNSLSDYYTAGYDSVILDKSLRKNIVFADHNLVTDMVFAEVNMIICRNVLIYFNKNLQDRVFRLFEESLIPGGYLCLGSKENLRFSDVYHSFDVIEENEKIYQKHFYAR